MYLFFVVIIIINKVLKGVTLFLATLLYTQIFFLACYTSISIKNTAASV